MELIFGLVLLVVFLAVVFGVWQSVQAVTGKRNAGRAGRREVEAARRRERFVEES